MGRISYSCSGNEDENIFDGTITDEQIAQEIEEHVATTAYIDAMIQQQFENDLLDNSDSDGGDQDGDEVGSEDVEEDDEDDDGEWIPMTANLTPIMEEFFMNHCLGNHSLHVGEADTVIAIWENLIEMSNTGCSECVLLDMVKVGGVCQAEWDAIEHEIESLLDDVSSSEEDDD